MNIPDFSKSRDGLVPVIIQDTCTSKILMLGYMNEAAYWQTIAEQRVVFYSRSRSELWVKGATSGNYLYVQDILMDCDNDCMLIKAQPAGPVCHTGAATCFNEANTLPILQQLENIIQQRRAQKPDGSYIASLFKKGINKIAQKVGEEAVELVIEAKDNNSDLFKNEAADLLFHYLLLLHAKGMSLSDIEEVLIQRQKA